MSTGTCERAALIEAMFDGRLGPSELASTERHLKGCPVCTEQLRELTSLRQTLRDSPRAIAPLEHQRARLALLRQAAAPPARPPRSVALIVAAVVAAPLVVWATAASLSSRTAEQPLSPAVSTTVSPSAKDLPGGLAPASSFAPAEVSSAPPTAVPQAPAVVSSTGDIATPVAPSSKDASGPRASSPRTAPATSSTPVAGGSLASRTETEKRAPGDRGAAAPSTSASGASREFSEAMEALSRGDFSAGAVKLDGFAASHPTDPRAEEAAYLRAIALERAGRMSEARAAARRYLAAYPQGAHRAQAQRLASDLHSSSTIREGFSRERRRQGRGRSLRHGGGRGLSTR